MEKVKVFKGGTLIDGNGGKPIEKSVVVIEGRRFKNVGRENDVSIPTGDNVVVIDTTGLTVLPGLIETHIHAAASESVVPSVFGGRALQRNSLGVLMHAIPCLQAAYVRGFTTIRDGGSGCGWFEVALRDALAAGIIEGPRYQATGYHITVSGGHACYLPYHINRFPIEEQSGMYADGADEWRKAARLQIWNGVDNVKFVASRDLISTGEPTNSQATDEEIAAVVHEAKSRGKTVIAHAQGHEAIMKSVKAGANVIVHGFWMDEECASLMAEKGVYWEPTNAYAKNMRDCAVKEVPEAFLKIYPNLLPQWAHSKAIRNWEDKVNNFNKILKTGVKVLMGSDAGMPYVFHGLNARELEINVLLGQSNSDALLGCTKYAAESLGIYDELGSVEPGKLADLVLIDGNPLEDITVLQKDEKIKLVLREGEEIGLKKEKLPIR